MAHFFAGLDAATTEDAFVVIELEVRVIRHRLEPATSPVGSVQVYVVFVGEFGQFAVTTLFARQTIDAVLRQQ
jgi:hypothetical protein